MEKRKTGAVILAAGKSDYMEELKPMLKVGQTTMIQKEIDTLRQAEITPIVVVTGYHAEELERHISHRGAVCIRNQQYATCQMFDSICQGLRYIQNNVDRVLLFPADIPLVSPETIERMAEAEGPMAVPICGGKKGHPVMLEKAVFPSIYSYRGNEGLRGAMEESGERLNLIEISDQGILLETNTRGDYESLLRYEESSRDKYALSFETAVTMRRETDCFDALTAGFLEAVGETGSMLGACQMQGISYSKGWKMVKLAEEQLGITFLTRQPGGSRGGFSALTEEGKRFLGQFRRLEQAVREAGDQAFREIFDSEKDV